MPNYQTATLLSSGGDVYTQLIDILKTYFEARGWTTNLFEDYRLQYGGDAYTGKRFHTQKSIGGHTRYLNLRSFKNQEIFTYNLVDQHTGIGAIASTGYDGATDSRSLTAVATDGGDARFIFSGVSQEIVCAVGDTVTISGSAAYNGAHTVTTVNLTNPPSVTVSTAFGATDTGTFTFPSIWDKMTGYTSVPINGATTSLGCGALDLPADNLTYYLFSDSGGDNIYLICANSSGYTGIAVGVTTTGNYFVSGAEVNTTAQIFRNMLLSSQQSGTTGNFALRKHDNTSWWEWPGTVLDSSGIPVITNTNTFDSLSTISQSMCTLLLYCSPDNFKGNNPLIPSHISVAVTNAGGLAKSKYTGTIPDIFYVNMKFITSLTELTFGGDVYKLFRLYDTDDANDSTIGLAILK